MTVEEITALPKIVRVAGYLSKMALLDECGAKLRVAHAHHSTDHDEKWTPEEEAEWDRLCDDLDPWWDALSAEEKAMINPIIVFSACLCRGEDPSEHVKLKVEHLPTGKYGITT